MATPRIDSELKALFARLEEQSADLEYQDALAKRRKQDRLRLREDLLDNSGVPRRYREKTLGNFIVTSRNKAAYTSCLQYVERWPEEGLHWSTDAGGLAIFGNPGTGKSHLAAGVVNALITRYAVQARYANVLDTFEAARLSISSDNINPIPRLVRAPFLVLDDLGSERPTDWTLEQIAHIVNYRNGEGLPVMVTSNAKHWRGLAQMLNIVVKGETGPREDVVIRVMRVIDRLIESVGDPIVIKGDSWRHRKK